MYEPVHFLTKGKRLFPGASLLLQGSQGGGKALCTRLLRAVPASPPISTMLWSKKLLHCLSKGGSTQRMVALQSAHGFMARSCPA